MRVSYLTPEAFLPRSAGGHLINSGMRVKQGFAVLGRDLLTDTSEYDDVLQGVVID